MARSSLSSLPITLIDRQLVAPQTYLLRFSRPHGYKYTSGQYAKLIVTSTPATDDNWRWLSFVSHPDSHTLDFLVRIRSSRYKKALADLAVGATAELGPATGEFSLWRGRRNICLVGGIGIAPIISLVAGLPRDTACEVVWSNASRQTTPNIVMPPATSRLKVTAVYTRTKPAERITGDWLARRNLVDNAAGYLISGPPRFVMAMESALLDRRIAPTSMKLEAFTGYP